jgi:hypothetical protein
LVLLLLLLTLHAFSSLSLLLLLLQVLPGANGSSAVEQQWCRSDELLSPDYDQLLSQPCYAAGECCFNTAACTSFHAVHS